MQSQLADYAFRQFLAVYGGPAGLGLQLPQADDLATRANLGGVGRTRSGEQGGTGVESMK